jgi:hypothetical protein
MIESEQSVSVRVYNDAENEMILYVEPWAEEFRLQPSEALEVELCAKNLEPIEVTYFNRGVSLHGFPGSIAVVRKLGNVIWTAHPRLEG